jgi:phosphatidylethanolamine/phosphatidyl-N-methylethanolamine N-methyltransferase
LSLRTSYTLLSPLYDLVVERLFSDLRTKSLGALPKAGSLDILINGIGTGLDLPHAPRVHRYVGLDLTRAMLERARHRRDELNLELVQGDSLALPFKNEAFDYAVLHLILAIVPDAPACLTETARVLKPGGTVLLLDKFLKRGERAPLRRALNPLVSRLVTRLDVVFEDALAATPELALLSDEAVLFGGWIRQITLTKTDRERRP